MNAAPETYYVYVLASISRTLYIGVTNDIERRVAEHAEGLTPGFTARYHVERLVYFEAFGEIEAAIAREKQLKGWRRAKKIELIESLNPGSNDLKPWRCVREENPGVLRLRSQTRFAQDDRGETAGTASNVSVAQCDFRCAGAPTSRSRRERLRS
jgi:putative endonuclease